MILMVSSLAKMEPLCNSSYVYIDPFKAQVENFALIGWKIVLILPHIQQKNAQLSIFYVQKVDVLRYSIGFIILR